MKLFVMIAVAVCSLLAAAPRACWAASPTAPNPLLAPWTGPCGGAPPFDQIQESMFAPAFEASMAEYRAEVDRIAQNPAAPTFENTLAALENAGRTYTRVANLFDVYTSTLNTPGVQTLDGEWKPKMAALSDAITQNVKLFKRIEAVYESRAKAGLTPEQQRLAWLYYTRFKKSGARLSPAEKQQLCAYNQRLASLYTRFCQNVQADEDGDPLILEHEADLVGVPASLRDAAAAAAHDKGLTHQWLIRNTRSAMGPFLTYAQRRDLREAAWRKFVSRGDHAGAHDNNPIVTEILRLRAQRARLLGYATFAHWQIEDGMAGTPDKAMALMMRVWPAAVARVGEEVAAMQAVADREGARIKIEPWDYRYYAEKVRKEKYDLDENEIKPYLQLDHLREALFWVAGQLYGFRFEPVHDVPTVRPDVSVYRVSDGSGHLVGLWYFDPYARTGKRSGAWMNEYRAQENFVGSVTPIVSNNANFIKPAPGAPVLVSWDDAQTMFHEFGHAMHGLLSAVHYPSLAGTSVARDFVEFPSQLDENWLSTPEVLTRFALHEKTGQAMPASLVARIRKAATFNQGFMTVEYLASAIVDMKLHLAGDALIDPRAFEKDTLHALGMPPQMAMRHRIPQFLHLFSDDEYAAGYYSYLWAEVLDHDAFQAFVEGGGPYDKAIARRFRDTVLSVGNTVDPGQAYRNFRGRDASIVPLLQFRGFPVR